MKNQMPDLIQAQKDELAALDALPDDQIDTRDIPEIRDRPRGIRGLFHMPPDERRKTLEELRSKRVMDIHANDSDLDDLPTSSLLGPEIRSQSHMTD